MFYTPKCEQAPGWKDLIDRLKRLLVLFIPSRFHTIMRHYQHCTDMHVALIRSSVTNRVISGARSQYLRPCSHDVGLSYIGDVERFNKTQVLPEDLSPKKCMAIQFAFYPIIAV